MSNKNKIISFFALIALVALVPISVYLFTRDRGLPPNFRDQGCSYLNRVSDLRDLLNQLMASADNDCLQKYSTKDLEIIWGIKIPEIGANNFYSNGSSFADEQIKPYHDALNKIYKNPNDAYVLTKVHNERKNQNPDRYYIQASHDFLKQYKGLNQWIPDKFDKAGWCNSRLEGDFVYQEPELLDGFIEPLQSYWTCQIHSYKLTQKVDIGIDPLVMGNNYVTELNIRIDRP